MDKGGDGSAAAETLDTRRNERRRREVKRSKEKRREEKRRDEKRGEEREAPAFAGIGARYPRARARARARVLTKQRI